MEKPISEITRAEWMVFNWLETTQAGDEERMFEAIGKRTPDEAVQAGSDYDELQEAIKTLQEEQDKIPE